MNDTLFDPELPAWGKSIAVFDLETTGLVLHEARIVTACAVELDAAGNIVGRDLEWLADPGIEIPEVAANVHGVTTEIARANGRPAAEVVAEIVATLRSYFERGIPVVAYNAPYDFTILFHEAVRHGIEPIEQQTPVIDPLVLDKHFDRYRSGKRRLENAAAHYGVALTDAHNATADAVAAGRVAQAIFAKFPMPADVRELHDAQVLWSKEQDISFAEFMVSKDPTFKANIGWPLKPH
ncbi:MAG: exonuclease domain-containing protein [Rhodoluna sp.]|nr:exonuclease domain-containing protein [Rhodoluna sp.]